MSREIIERVTAELKAANQEWLTMTPEEVAKFVAPIIERLLADERKPMKCEHPKACWIQEDSSDPDKRGVFYEKGWCSACAEREKVREMFSAALRKIEGGDDGWNFALARAEKIIRQLDLTKDLAASSTEEGGDAHATRNSLRMRPMP